MSSAEQEVVQLTVRQQLAIATMCLQYTAQNSRAQLTSAVKTSAYLSKLPDHITAYCQDRIFGVVSTHSLQCSTALVLRSVGGRRRYRMQHTSRRPLSKTAGQPQAKELRQVHLGMFAASLLTVHSSFSSVPSCKRTRGEFQATLRNVVAPVDPCSGGRPSVKTPRKLVSSQ